jgi:mitochondrial fusion and transport protein UGO1
VFINFNSTMASPASLRDLYTDPSSAWAFLSPQPGQSSPPNSATPSSSTPSYQWSARPAQNSVFDLSPSLDFTESDSVNVTVVLKGLLASAFMQYTSTAIAMPWEVGKMLLQVQWVPRETGEPEPNDELDEEEDAVSVSLDAYKFSHH